MKMASINLARVLDGSRRGQAMARQLERVAAAWTEKGRALQARLDRLQAARERETQPAPAEARFQLELEAQLISAELRHLRDGLELELEATRKHLRALLLEEVRGHVEAAALARSIDVVLATPSAEIVYSSPRLDITDEIIERLDQAPGSPERAHGQVRASTFR